jgi:hypothetical protein
MEKAAERLLQRLDPSSASRERVQNLLLLMLAINPRFDYQLLAKWLSKSIPVLESRKMIKTIFTTHRGPFSFVLDSSIGWMVVIYQDNSGPNIEGEEFMKVPFVSSSLTSVKSINADIRVGDEINLSNLPKVWFIVHEIRPQSNSVLLIASTSDSGTKSRRIKGREYKEVYCLSLIGCTVRRRCTLQCEAHYPKSCFCQSSASDVPILFQFPKPDPTTALESLAAIVDEECQTFGLFEKIDDYGSDHVIKMQRASFVQMWLDKKRNLIAAKKYLSHIHCSLSLSRFIFTIFSCPLLTLPLSQGSLAGDWKSIARDLPRRKRSFRLLERLGKKVSQSALEHTALSLCLPVVVPSPSQTSLSTPSGYSFVLQVVPIILMSFEQESFFKRGGKLSLPLRQGSRCLRVSHPILSQDWFWRMQIPHYGMCPLSIGQRMSTSLSKTRRGCS